jgi:hypothetical protein
MKSVSGESGQLITASKFYQELMKSSGSGELWQLITTLKFSKLCGGVFSAIPI